MYLSSINIHGFKSFAHKISLSFSPDNEFHKGITAVVGPNGSGKSNIADAIRWVLGEQSIKLLRGKKTEDVIFAGSAIKSRLGFAEVMLTIQNDDGAFPLDVHEVSIGRRLYRDGVSEYLVNGNKVRLLDISLLLARAGIGGRSYAVIGQGMIDHVLSSTPSERKEFFDEASGVREFELKKKQTEHKLNASRENLTHAQTVIEELTPRIRFLSKAVKRLEERADVERALHAMQRDYYGSEWKRLEENYARILTNNHEVSKRLEIASAKRNAVLLKLQHIEHTKTTSESLLSLQKQYEQFRRERETIYESLMKTQTEYEIIKARSRVVSDSRQIPQGEVSGMCEELIKRFDEMRVELFACTHIDEVRALHEKIEQFTTRLHEIHVRYAPRVAVSESDTEQRLTYETKEFQKKLSSADEALQKIKKEMSVVANSETQKKGSFFEAQRELETASRFVHAIEREFNQLEIEKATLATKRDTLMSEMRYELGNRKEDVLNAYKEIDVAIDARLLQSRMFQLKHQYEAIGTIDPETVNEYQEVKERYDFLVAQVEDLLLTIESLESGIHDLEVEMKRRRTETLEKINHEFAHYFSVLFSGGKAGIVSLYADDVVVDDEDSAEEGEKVKPKKLTKKNQELIGVEIHAQPPGKRIKDIAMLSGGERAMVSVALICAILKVSPSPFVVLDEVDAALDEANSVRYADILEQLSSLTQFIVITHNRASMNKSRVIYGVTMGDDGVSQLLSIELEKASTWAK